MDTVYKSEQIEILSKNLGITKVMVRSILEAYINRVISALERGETTKFLNICYLVNDEDEGKTKYHETLAYISSEIGNQLRVGKVTVYRMLSDFEDLIAKDVCHFYTYTITGVISISRIEDYHGRYKVRIKKSSNLSCRGIRVVSMNSFKRKVEYYDGKNA